MKLSAKYLTIVLLVGFGAWFSVAFVEVPLFKWRLY
jgi:hypothetical protein